MSAITAESKTPAIRFKGFSGEWEECSLSKFVSSLDAGVSVNSGERAVDGSEFGILKTSCVSNGIFEPAENKFVFQDEELNRLKEPVTKNTIIISRMNTPALVGANAYIEKGFENLFLPDRLWAAKPTSSGSLRFIAYILGSAKGRAVLSELATGTSGSMKNISKPSVLELKFQVPKDQEQTQIGALFQQLDLLIAQHQQKHDKLLTVKKALLEKMFPQQGKTQPAIRFKGFSDAWEEKALGGVGDVTSVKRIHQSDWSSTGVRFLRARDIVAASKNERVIDPLFIPKTKYEEYSALSGKVKKGDLLITGVGTIGIPLLIVDEQPLYFKDGNIIWFKNENKIDGNFLYYSFINNSVQNFIKLSAGTGTVGTYTIDSGKKTPIKNPEKS